MPTVIEPPWIAYPDNEPTWGGWRQGYAEAWLLRTWFPWWRTLTNEEKDRYLLQYPPPDEEWHIYMTQYWR